MESVKVCLLEGGLPFYGDLKRFPPDDIQYICKDYGTGISEYYNSQSFAIKRRIANCLLNSVKIPVMTYVMDNTCDLIHSNRGIIPLNRRPFVIDIDYVGYFFGNNMFNPKLLKKSFLKKSVEYFLSRDNCKKILCWSNAAKNSFTSVFGADNALIEKVEVLYPAVPTIPIVKEPKTNKIKILYVSSSLNKGAVEVLLAFKTVMARFKNVELTFKCDLPDQIQKDFACEAIHFLPYRSQILPRESLIRELYMSADIFLYPTLSDLFGLNLLDAMVAGLPIVTTNTFAIPEIVQHGKSGVVVEEPYSWHNDNYLPKTMEEYEKSKRDQSMLNFINKIAEQLCLLIENPALRSEMGTEGRRMVEQGRFSLEQRNKALARIYKGAVQ